MKLGKDLDMYDVKVLRRHCRSDRIESPHLHNTLIRVNNLQYLST